MKNLFIEIQRFIPAIWALLLVSILSSAFVNDVSADEGNTKQQQYKITDADIVVYDEIQIDRPIEHVWPEVINFITWYFTGQRIKIVRGVAGELGHTVKIDDNLLHQVISIRPQKSMVWKTCYIDTCEKDVVFTDFEVKAVGDKTIFSRRSYSQNFWAEDIADDFLFATKKGKVPVLVSDLSLRFKRFVEGLD